MTLKLKEGAPIVTKATVLEVTHHLDGATMKVALQADGHIGIHANDCVLWIDTIDAAHAWFAANGLVSPWEPDDSAALHQAAEACEFIGDLLEECAEEVEGYTPLLGAGLGQEVANLIAFLRSELATAKADADRLWLVHDDLT